MRQENKKVELMKKLFFTLLLCLLIPSAVFAAPVKKAVGIIYLSKSGEVVNVEENCLSVVNKSLHDNFAKYGIQVDPVEMPLNTFLQKANKINIPETDLKAEWNRFVSSNYDVILNVYIDRYLVNADGTADASVRMVVTLPSNFEKILVKSEASRKNVQNTAPIDVTKNALSEIIRRCGKEIKALT